MAADDDWDEATTWSELLDRNKQFIINSFEKKAPRTSPYLLDPRTDCDTEEDVNTLLRLQSYDLFVLHTEPSWHGSLPEKTCHDGVEEEERGIPCLEFIVKKDLTTRPFVKALLRDPKLAVGVWKGRSGEPYEPKKHTHFSYWMSRELGPQIGAWTERAGPPPLGTPLSLEEWRLENVKALETRDVYICTLAMKMDDEFYKTADNEEFGKAIKNFDLIHEVASHRDRKFWRLLKRMKLV